MKKWVRWGIVLACLYVVLGVVAGFVLPPKITAAEKKLPGIRLVIAHITDDQALVAAKMRDVLGSGKAKVDGVVTLLGDPALNRLAQIYLNADWSSQLNDLSNRVKQDRQCKEEIEKLKRRKRTLTMRLNTPSERRRLYAEWQEIERKLDTLESQRYVKPRGTNALDQTNAQPRMKREDYLKTLASEYQTEMIDALTRAMSGRLAELRREESEAARLRGLMSWFNFWPMNLICKMPPEE